MWRSFFYAVGIGLFAMGLQTLVVDHVNVPKDTRFQNVIRKLLSDDKPRGAATGAGPSAGAPYGGAGTAANSQTSSYRPLQGYQSGSRFGPSRFEGPAYGDYGGARVSQSGSRASAPGPGNFFGAAASGNTGNGRVNAVPASYPGAASAARVSLQKVNVREWMPWSLLAAGAIIFLYTHSLGRGRVE